MEQTAALTSEGMVGAFRRRLRADFARNPFWEQRTTLAVWRLGQAAHGRPGVAPFLIRRVHQVLDFVWVKAYIGAELPKSVVAGPGIRLPHNGRGVILHPSASLGAGVTLYHQVTIGVSGGSRAPVIDDNAYLGAGAKIIGPITVGEGAKIGANAVVVRDVPPGRTAVGIPARILDSSTAPAAKVV